MLKNSCGGNTALRDYTLFPRMSFLNNYAHIELEWEVVRERESSGVPAKNFFSIFLQKKLIGRLLPTYSPTTWGEGRWALINADLS